jgi:hypothetical protein
MRLDPGLDGVQGGVYGYIRPRYVRKRRLCRVTTHGLPPPMVNQI